MPPREDIRMRGFAARISLDEALSRLAARVVPLPPSRVAIEPDVLPSLLGRCLAEEIRSAVDLPPFRRAAMDGYAVRAGETTGASEHQPLRLRLRGRQPAGAAPPAALLPGDALRIMTGAAVPDGADAVVMAEYAREVAGADGLEVALHEAVAPSANVMPVGEDVRRGEALYAAGHRLRPQDLGLLGALGLPDVALRPAVRIAIIPTGGELVPAGTAPRAGAVVDTNSPMLAALAALHGGLALARRPVPDDPVLIRDALRSALEDDADMVVLIGGTAVGDEDHVPAVVAGLGELLFHGVALRPGSPTGVGLLSGPRGPVPVVLAPGSPVAAMIAFDLFAGACLCLLEGRPPTLPYSRTRGRLARKVSSAPGRTDFVRVKLHDGTVEPLMTGGASILSSTTRADGLLIVPHDLEGYAAGAEVELLLYRSETPLH